MRTKTRVRNVQLDKQFTDLLLQNYQEAGEKVGYWATRFLQAVRRRGGVAQARTMLRPRTAGQRIGLDRLIDAKHKELTVEATVLRPKFKALFTLEERRIARERLAVIAKKVAARREVDRFHPEVLEDPQQYVEGARRWIAVNWFERSRKARAACVKHYGYGCAVCGISMNEVYGQRGKGFIHVHHLNPAAMRKEAYEVNPARDLRPVCPNCHAMLHRGKKVLSIEALQRIVAAHKRTRARSPNARRHAASP